jgi:hypothetical protein
MCWVTEGVMLQLLMNEFDVTLGSYYAHKLHADLVV